MNAVMPTCKDEVLRAFPFPLAPMNEAIVEFWCSKQFKPWMIVRTIVCSEAQASRARKGKSDTSRHEQVKVMTKLMNEKAESALAASVQMRRVFPKEIDLLKWQEFLMEMSSRTDYSQDLVALVFEMFVDEKLTRIDQLDAIIIEVQRELNAPKP